MDVFLGTIMIFGGNFAPVGWAMCQGQLLSVAQNTALFSLLGTMYGGDGQQTFGLPNLQSRVPIGMGKGTNLSSYSEGQMGGAENVTLSTPQLPSHTHTANGQSGSADKSSPAGAFPAQVGSSKNPGLNIYTQTTGNLVSMASGMISSTGNNQPVPILPPYIALNYIIALQGIYPSRS